MLLRRVCGFLFFLDSLKTFDHLEGEAHYAVLLAFVLDVDGLVVVVDKYLGEVPLVVVEPLGPLGDGLVLYLAGLLTSSVALSPSVANVSYPEEALFIPQRAF